ncbi:MAG: hypothetical protein AAFN12_13545 [Cyanobacteria bacterium J06560_2]
MVFATDFDPIDSSTRRQAPSKVGARDGANAETVSPLHQTNRLIAQAQAKSITQKAAQQARSRNMVAQKVQSEGEDIAIAARGLSQPVTQNVLAPLPLPTKPTLPLGLQILNRVQHGTTAFTGLLIAGALALYGSSVYVDKSADRAMAHLNHLQGESQQLTSANESIKQSLAEQALQENSGLEPYESGDVLFVTPEPLRESMEPEEKPVKRLRPLGY